MPPTGYEISVAPMMDWTDRHCRYFMRQLSPSALLYTEMVTAAAIVHGDADRFLRFNEEEHPVALQLGGSDPDWMARATASAAAYGYDEVNINVGCPSDRVQSGQFGACLMAKPDLVAECFAAMQKETDAPVTVKSRIGIDDRNDYGFLRAFVEPLYGAGCRKFVVHARIAILEGLSPKENRTVPPLDYERVYRLKRDFPECEIVINGGLTAVADIDTALEFVDGVMIGRQAYHQPYFLAELEAHRNTAWRALYPLRRRGRRVAGCLERLRRVDVVAGGVQDVAVRRQVRCRRHRPEQYLPAHARTVLRPARGPRLASLHQRACTSSWRRQRRLVGCT